MIITREIINKNIQFTDVWHYNDEEYTTKYSFDQLSKTIDMHKNMLEYDYSSQPGQSILIGEPPGIHQTALIFAALELGLSIIVVDYGRPAPRSNVHKYVDPKTEILLPIDFFVIRDNHEQEKFNFFKAVCNTTILIADYKYNDSANNNIYCLPDTILLKCTSSGTTGTPKRIEHNHNFMYHLVNRNKQFFDKTVGVIANLNHGSSLATYFLPVLMSESVSELINIQIPPEKLSTVCRFNLDHLMIPYSNMVDNFFLKTRTKKSNLIIYTLSTIKKHWKEFIDNGNIGDVISIFGSNETSGPILINRLSDIKFKENKFKPVDKFYNTYVDNNNELQVDMPYYETTICTNDNFEIIKGDFYHRGRNDLIRVNGLLIELERHKKFIDEILHADIVTDTVHNELYLAVWEHDDEIDTKLENIDKFLRHYSRGSHRINKTAILVYEDFLSGIKLDQELLRDYFRKHVKKYKSTPRKKQY